MDDKWNRLATAILMQAFSDWKLHVKELRNKKKQSLAIAELKQLIDFIMSDWFLYLTEYNCPQDDCVMALLNQIKIPSIYKLLYDHYQKKAKKKEKKNDNK